MLFRSCRTINAGAVLNRQMGHGGWYTNPKQIVIRQFARWVAFGSAFVVGWLINRQSVLLAVWQRRWHWNLVLAVAATFACLGMLGKISQLQPTPAGEFTLAYALVLQHGNLGLDHGGNWHRFAVFFRP